MRLLASTLLLTAALASAPAAVIGQAPSPLPEGALAVAAQLRQRALTGDGGYRIVESLTTEVGPRLAGSEGDARAVAWAVAKLKSLGYDRVWTEPVSFPAWRRGHERAEVLGPHAQPLRVAALGGSVGTGGVLEAEVVEFPDLAALSAAPEGSLDGKIAYVARRMERFRDGSGYGPAVAARSNGAIEAARKGARALLIRSIGTDTHRLPHTGMMRYDEAVPKIPAAALSNPDADQLSRLLARGAPVRLRLDIDAGTDGQTTSYNVIGEVTGRERPDEVVVIGGHLDSWDLGTGAVDDGAGIGIGFAAGALIAELPPLLRPARSVRVIAWANEEQGLLGANAYAQAHGGEIARHAIGAESDFGAGRIYALHAGVDAASWPAIERIGAALAPLGIQTLRDGGGPGPDISPLSALGMPWAQLAQDGSDYFDYHHTADDTLDKIDPDAIRQQVAAYAVFAYLAADMEGRPAAPVKAGE